MSIASAGLATAGVILQHDAMRCLLLAACAVALSGQSIHPASAAPLAPAGKWIVDFGENRCLAVRAFGPADDPVHLALRPSPIGDVLQMQIVEKGIKQPGTQEKIRLTLGSGEPIAMLQLQYGADGKQVRLVNLTKEQVGRLSSSTTLDWSGRGKRYQLTLGPMTKLLQTVDTCKAELAEHWNATLTRQMTIKKPATLERPLVSLFSSNDYPWDAIRSGQSGLAHVVVLVDDKGGIADCTLIATSGIAVLDAQTCIIIRKRAKFAPAIGADGKPTRSIFHQRVNWAMR